MRYQGANTMSELDSLIVSLYKSESSKLLAILVRIFGMHNAEMAEDVLQDAFNKALTHWAEQGVPEAPSAWLMQTAKNQAIDTIRANHTRISYAEDLTRQLQSEWTRSHAVDIEFQQERIKDGQLRMIFMCCDERIKLENRLPLILKNLCGFSIKAVSRALLLPEATVKKRLLRTRQQLKNHHFEFPQQDKLKQAMETVHTALYLLFNEGFHSSDGQQLSNFTFCQEAVGLLQLIIEYTEIVNRDTLGLFALMHFHIARAESRQDADGNNIPIDMQDRSLWNRQYINTALYFLNLARKFEPGVSDRFYIEAKIASEHCKAKTFELTNWAAISDYYTDLVEVTASPVARLNRAIAIGYTGELESAILQVEKLQHDRALNNSHMPLAILAHLNARAGRATESYQFAAQARQLGGTEHENQVMMQQLERLLR